ncbi:glycoside hydrolase family 10 protein [Paenibacillus mendelii]|uniref:Glycoside hydrolase family 10 protein n=1 Tax=Paenibacillus mendelii TaxID=206163 RepID=A0ABV6JE45_9BACL|nr:family 10 glycosylhydrolase [Paenibacillus mendelii]MCQ6563353.1 family 10 glycosylhydrolase [Paenibacillus mendelii]
MTIFKKAVLPIICLTLMWMVPIVSVPAADAAESGTSPYLILPDNSRLPIEAINAERVPEGITLYTGSNEMDYTAPFGEGTAEYIVSEGIVLEINRTGDQGTYIPFNNYVISASGTAEEKLRALAAGDAVALENVAIDREPSRYAVVDGERIAITKTNAFRDEGDVVLFDSAFGPYTNTNPWGLELVIEGGFITGIARFDTKTPNNSAIPEGGAVLSVQAGSPSFAGLNAKIGNGTIRQGDAVRLVVRQETHLASKTGYDALDPKVKADNPGGWDEANDRPYDGFRGADQLIVYTSSYGNAMTGTNPWGYEVVVDENNQIVAAGGNNSAIPENGFVLSGHGIKAEWLKIYAKFSATVTLDRSGNELIIALTPQSYLKRADFRIGNVKRMLAESKASFLDVPYAEIERKIGQAEGNRETIKALIESRSYDEMAVKTAELDALIDEIGNLNLESRKVEHRAIWIRPLETSVEEVREHLTKIADANLNQVYVEAWWNGYTIYPSDNPLAPHNPIYNGFDVLDAYLDVAEELGLEVHAWVENAFLEGNKLEEKPEWSMIRRDGADYWQVDGHTFYWINPALPEVRQFITELYTDMVSRYPVDGLHLDYIRYPDNYGTDIDYGYDEYTRTQFMDAYKTNSDPLGLYPGDELWPEWQQFRMDIITGFVGKLVPDLKAVRPELAISAAVYSDFYKQPEFKLQEAGLWLQRGYLDNVFPMSYKLDAPAVVHDAEETLKLAGNKSYVTMGLGPQARVAKPVVVQQAALTQKLGTSGSAYFEFISYFGDRYDEPLKQGLYRDKAIVPFSQPGLSVKTLLADLVRKIDAIYVPNGGMSDGRSYEKMLKPLINRLQENNTIDQRAAKLDRELAQIASALDGDSSVNTQVKSRMKTDLEYAQHIIRIYNSKRGE